MRSATLFDVSGIVLILILALILLRPKALAEFTEGLRQGIKEFRNASREVSDEFTEALYGQHSEKGDKIGNAILALTAFFGTLVLALLLWEILK